jgi:hypothetical protein
MRKPAFRICRSRRTSAGIATEIVESDGVGVTLHADSPEAAVERARRLMPWLPRNLVAIPEAV